MQQTCGEKRLEVGAHVTPNAFDKEVQDSARHDAPRSGLISSEFWSTGMPRSSASPFAFATVSSRQPPKEADLKSDWAIVVLVLLGLSFFTCVYGVRFRRQLWYVFLRQVRLRWRDRNGLVADLCLGHCGVKVMFRDESYLSLYFCNIYSQYV
ncbi:unnamed protein product [Durusdinium trenchii]|uniref:Uncharacterized protein n=2 Tax=Durusdinium trenchii TaxID=1381693 RepID=A0ABP0NXS2_9DINO